MARTTSRAPARKAAGKKAVRKKTAKVARPKTRTRTASRRAASEKRAPARPARRTQSGPGGSGKIRVRMYRVGFGDFFLVSVPSASGDGYKHILIDCGVHAKDAGSIEDSVAQMAAETDSELALLIVTHRHADHISGFGKCQEIFSRFKVERIWMSWFENPHDGKAKALQQSIVALASQLHVALAARHDPAAEDYINMVQNITGEAVAGAAGGNDKALAMLHSFPGNPPIDYYQSGDKAVLPRSLVDAGLSAMILGPPINHDLIKKTDSKPQEYLAMADAVAADPTEPFPAAYRVAYDRSAAAHLLAQRLVEDRIAAAQPDLLAAKAAMANNLINNQSLVVLFSYKGKTLLFAGDAQWGNWANFLFGGVAKGDLTAESKAILGKLDFYKVGHHGSTNATPKDALAAMRDGCVAMCSTQPKAYNEVPRGPLMDALAEKTRNQLVRSDQVAAGQYQKLDAKVGAVPKIFKATSTGTCGFIDYEL